MTREAPARRVPIKTSTDVLAARERIREAAARFGFDHFDQVQLATGISEVGRDLVAAGGGELEFSISPARPRRLVITARCTETARRGLDYPGVAAARRLIGPPPTGREADDGTWNFSRVLPRSATLEDGLEALRATAVDPFSAMHEQDAELLRLHEELQRRDAELESVSRELEETNRGVLALYAELDDKAESVRQMSEERARFLSNVTHELRTPLSSITALCRLLLKEGGAELRNEQGKQIAYIQKSAQDLLDFVSDLLDLAKVGAGKVAVHAAPFELDDVLTALRGMFRPLSADANVPVIFEFSPVPTMETDEHKVSQILRNLISNALKFTESGEIRVSATHERATDEVLVTVADTGIGIAADDIERIFDEFIQVENRRGRRERSSGLGLPLSRKLAELMGGSISVESQLGLGSKFLLRIPRIYSQPSAEGRRPIGVDGYVLVVDDDAVSRYVAKEELERLGWRVVEAADGETALLLAREQECRAIVLDLVMPGTTGIDVLRRLGEHPSTAALPVVIRTSLPLADIDSASIARAEAVFSKSEDMRALADLISRKTAASIQVEAGRG
ncbi:MAG TPA: ATP-binding protein [Candidatus Dormibacteraeota bacterium]|nr:ATP-binding protein [Candidatus Dormibacteraeota bacterium]